MASLLLLAHVPPEVKTGADESLALGDLARIFTAAIRLREAGMRVTVCVDRGQARLAENPIVRAALGDIAVVGWEDLAGLDPSSFGHLVYLDHPDFWPAIRARHQLPEAVVLLAASSGTGFKARSEFLVSRLFAHFCSSLPLTPASSPAKTGARGILHRVGLNHLVPEAWRIKSPPLPFWQETAKALAARGCEVSWQEGADDLNAYIGWISRQDVLVTPNSLGFHLAQLLGKGVVFLQGPTWCEEVGWLPPEMVFKPGCGLSPCYQKQCPVGTGCFAELSPAWVADRAKRLLA